MSNLLNDFDSGYLRDLAVAELHSGVPKSVEQLRPKVSIDGDKWCVLYGENLQDGVCGFGDTPMAAMKDFDNALYTAIKQPK